MRILFMGTPDFAVPTLQSLIDSEHEVVAVVTQPDRPKGRGGNVLFTPVKEKAVEYQIPVLQPQRVKEEEWLDRIEEYAPDAIVVVAFGQILPKRLLDYPRYGCLNVHASLLPKLRGSAPIQWAVLNGEKQSGVTTMCMDVGIDTGDILLQQAIPLAEDETGGSLHDKLMVMGGPLILETLRQAEAGTLVRHPQAEADSSYVRMLDKAMGHLDYSQPAEVLCRYVRGLNPWPSAYTRLHDKMVKVWSAKQTTALEGVDSTSFANGVVAAKDKDTIWVKTQEGLIGFTELQLEGKKRMSVDALLRGYSIEVGEQFE